jgi:hypothetical protein
MRYILKKLTKNYRTMLTRGRGWFLNILGVPMILVYNAKSLFIVVFNASLRWLNTVVLAAYFCRSC